MEREKVQPSPPSLAYFPIAGVFALTAKNSKNEPQKIVSMKG
jgi:hypothetical protein